jgi:SAM-dependent methyltransferase
MLRQLYRRVKGPFVPTPYSELSKQAAELSFWKQEVLRYQEWFNGKFPMYKTDVPRHDQKIFARDLKDSSILTWHKLHQEAKYLSDLALDADAFQGLKVLDVGAGPIPSATGFRGCSLYCLEPLLHQYLEAGFPIHCYPGVTFVHAVAESIPFDDAFFDAVISVNAIDHVDDLPRTAAELQRVLKPGGLFRMHVHYHAPTKCEPIHIDDRLFQDLFHWCKNLKKLKETRQSFSMELPADQSFALWSNF